MYALDPSWFTRRALHAGIYTLPLYSLLPSDSCSLAWLTPTPMKRELEQEIDDALAGMEPARNSNPDELEESELPRAVLPAGNRVPPELLAKIWGYLPERSCVDACRLALVNEAFYRYFTSEKLWLEMPSVDRNYVLLQSTVRRNIWGSVELNRWYNESQYALGLELPPEVWRHRQLLLLVLQWVNVIAAPSMEDFRPYAKDRKVVLYFLIRMPVVDCLKYVSSEMMADQNVVLKAVERFPQAVGFCHDSLLNDREFIKKVVAENGHCIEFLGDYRSDSELITSASRTSLDLLAFARGEALKDTLRIGEYIKSKEPKPPKGTECRLCGHKEDTDSASTDTSRQLNFSSSAQPFSSGGPQFFQFGVSS